MTWKAEYAITPPKSSTLLYVGSYTSPIVNDTTSIFDIKEDTIDAPTPETVTVVVFFFYKWIVTIIASKMLMVKLVAPTYVFISLLWKFALGSIVVGGFASFIALRKFLTV